MNTDHARWLLVARVALLAISILAVVVYIAGIPANPGLVQLLPH